MKVLLSTLLMSIATSAIASDLPRCDSSKVKDEIYKLLAKNFNGGYASHEAWHADADRIMARLPTEPMAAATQKLAAYAWGAHRLIIEFSISSIRMTDVNPTTSMVACAAEIHGVSGAVPVEHFTDGDGHSGDYPAEPAGLITKDFTVTYTAVPTTDGGEYVTVQLPRQQ